MKKQVLLLLLALMAIVGNLSAQRPNDVFIDYGNGRYRIDFHYQVAHLTKWVPRDGNTVANVPDSVPYNNVNYPVTAFAGGLENESTFSSRVTEISIPRTVCDITWFSFSLCRNLIIHYDAERNPISFLGSPFYDNFTHEPFVASVDFGEHVKTIPQYCFSDIGVLDHLQLPASLKTIGTSAFDNAFVPYVYADLNIPNNVTSIGRSAFDNCGFTGDIHLPADSLTEIGETAFRGGKMRNVVIPGSVRKIGGGAFCNSQLRTVVIGEGITSLSTQMFSGCSQLIDVKLPSTLETIGNGAFQNCTSLTEIEFPESVSYIDSYSFCNCSSIYSLELGSNLTHVNTDAFNGCRMLRKLYYNAPNLNHLMASRPFGDNPEGNNLNEIIIGPNVYSIPDQFFRSCMQLEHIHISAATPPEIYAGTFSYSKSVVLHVPSESYDAYCAHPYWGQFTVVPSSVRVLGQYPSAANDYLRQFFNGSIYYDVSTNTLELTNVNINTDHTHFIEILNPGVTIRLNGDNHINTTDGYALVSYADFSIEGNGTLHLRSPQGVRAMYGNMTVKALLDVEGTSTTDGSGITGTYLYDLTVESASLTVTTRDGSVPTIQGFHDVNLVNCQYNLPDNAVYNTTRRRMEYPDGSHVAFYTKTDADIALKVAGVQVTYTNAHDILGNGKVVYEPATKTLHLYSANISDHNHPAIENNINGLTIQTTNHSYINHDGFMGAYGIYSNGDLTIKSEAQNGFLDVKGSVGIYVPSGNLTIESLDSLNVEGYVFAICNNSSTDTLTISNPTPLDDIVVKAHLTQSNSSYSNPIYPIRYGHIKLDYVGVTYPRGAYWSESEHCFRKQDGTIIGYEDCEVRIGKLNYPIRIALKGYINTANARDVYGDGTMSYDPETNTLTLNNYTHQHEGMDGWLTYNGTTDFTINLVGNNVVTLRRNEIYTPSVAININHSGNATITGSGTLTLDDPDATYGLIGVLYSVLNIEGGCTVTAIGKKYGADLTSEGTLNVNDATFIVRCDDGDLGETPLLCGALNMSGCAIKTVGVTWNATEHKFYKNGSPYKGEVTIGPVEYPLFVGDIQVNTGNASDVLGDGTVSYDQATNTLTLNGLDLTAATGISTSIDYLRINLIGENKILATSGVGVLHPGSLTIEGTGSLWVMGTSGIADNNSSGTGTLTIEDGCRVFAGGTGSGSACAGVYSPAGCTLTVNGTLGAEVLYSTRGAICGFAQLNMPNSTFIEPSGASYSTTDRRMKRSGSNYNGRVIIGHNYGIEVAGVAVTSFNCDSITGTGIEGLVTYDLATNTLTLDNATINSEVSGIDISRSDLKIVLVGDNIVTTNYNYDGIFSGQSLTIMGEGTLTVTGMSGIEIEQGDLTIEGGCTVNAHGLGTTSGFYGGIAADHSSSCGLFVKNSTVRATAVNAQTYSPIYGFSSVSFTGCTLMTPALAEWDDTHRYVKDYTGNATADEVLISQHYLYIKVGGLRVGPANADHITGSNIEGSVSYNPVNNTLVLDNATITASANIGGIDNSMDDLNVVLVGNNTITAADGYGIYTYKNITLMGEGTLDVISSDNHGIYMFNAAQLTIRDGSFVRCITQSTDNRAGIFAQYGGTLYVREAVLIAETPNNTYYPVKGFTTFMEYAVSVCEPMSADWSDTDHCFVTFSGNMVEHHVAIASSYGITVNDVAVCGYNADDVLGDGTVRYDAVDNKLYLDGANITSVWTNTSSKPNLVIDLGGKENTLSSGVMLQYDATIQGPGVLNVVSTGISARGDLVLDNCIVNVVAATDDPDEQVYTYAIDGDYSNTLTINRSAVRATAYVCDYPKDPIDFGNLVLNDSYVESPSGAEWGNYGFQLNGHSLRETLVIVAKYDLVVGDVQVSSSNADDIMGDGTARYDADSHTLTLSNFDATCGDGVVSTIEGLTIVLEGTNRIEAVGRGIYSMGDLTIDGIGRLDVTGASGIVVPVGNLDIKGGCKVNVDASSGQGIGGSPNYDMTVDGAAVKASAAAEGTDSLQKTVAEDYVTNMYVPVYGDYISGTVKCEYVIPATMMADMLGLNLTAMQLHLSTPSSANMGNARFKVFVKEVPSPVAGMFKGYADATVVYEGELDFTHETMEVPFNAPYYYNGGNLLVGFYNTATGTSQRVVFYGTTTEQQSAIVSSMAGGMQFNFVPMTTFTCHEASRSAISGFNNLTLEGCQILEPADAEWNTETHNVMVNGYNAALPVGIGAIYDLQIAGDWVTGMNADDVLGDGGSVQYDALNNVLTLNNANIVCQSLEVGLDGIHYYGSDDLTILLIGTNSITGPEDGIDLGQYSPDVLITGRGSLNITTPYGICANGDASLTIAGGCHVEVNSSILGVSISYLTVNSSELYATGTSQGSISVGHQPTLTHCSITMPAGAAWSNYYVRLNGSAVKTQVCITAEVFPIEVDGIAVDAINAHDVLNDGGSVVYDYDENTLTLTNARIEDGGVNAINVSEGDLKIVLVGDNVINMDEAHGIFFEGHGTLTLGGTGTLAITGNLGIEIYGNMTLEDNCTVTVNDGISGYLPYVLTLNGGTLIANYDGYNSPITDFANVNGCAIVYPTDIDLIWNNGNEGYGFYLEDNEEIPYEDTVILSKSYDIWVCGTPVTDYNFSDVLGDRISGKVSYDVENNILTLDNVNIASGGGICSERQDLTIALQGNNVMGVSIAAKNLVIEGPGNLDVDDSNCAIQIKGTSFVVRDGCTVNASVRNNTGNALRSTNNAALTVIDARLVAQFSSTSKKPIEGFGSLSMQPSAYCHIAEPADASWSTTNHCVVFTSSGNAVTSTIVIDAEYGITVNGTAVTGGNANDVLGDGTVSYDYANNVLTLNNASISNNDVEVDGIYNEHPNLTLALEGANTIHVGGYGILSDAAMSIVGPGSLDLSGYYGINTTHNLNIENCIVNAVGTYHSNSTVGIAGSGGRTLTVTNAKLTASVNYGTSTDGIISDFSHLVLNGVNMVSPAGGSYNESTKKLFDANGNLFHGEVIIQPVKTYTQHIFSVSDWDCAANWEPEGVPTAMDRVVLASNCKLYGNAVACDLDLTGNYSLDLYDGAMLETGSIATDSWQNLTIPEGAQVYSHGTGYQPLMTLKVDGWEESLVGYAWTPISMPFSNYTSTYFYPADESKDLYRYNETNHNGEEWENYKANAFTYELGRGYLFASSTTGATGLVGMVNESDVTITLTYTEPTDGYPIAGFNLIGNPFTHDIYKGPGAAIDDSHLEEGYYTIDSNGLLRYHSDDEPIAPLQAIMVRTDATITLTIKNTMDKPTLDVQGE